MILYKEAAPLKNKIERTRQSGKKIGFVPTMGALHEGHISLINMSKTRCDITICSIFVNPAQFNDPKDFEKYPTTISSDIYKLEKTGCDILFIPAVSEMYPSGTAPVIPYDLGEIEFLLEGKFRPGHFQGVCMAVHRLLDIVNPDQLFIGQKDYQQCLVIKRLAQLLKHPVLINIAPTVREQSGLAMSSRNLRLNDVQKRNAECISKKLAYIKTHYTTQLISELQKDVKEYLLNNGFNKVDYVSIADADTLQPIIDVTKAGRLIALIAAYIGEVRLIDNMMLSE